MISFVVRRQLYATIRSDGRLRPVYCEICCLTERPLALAGAALPVSQWLGRCFAVLASVSLAESPAGGVTLGAAGAPDGAADHAAATISGKGACLQLARIVENPRSRAGRHSVGHWHFQRALSSL